jgi:phage/plasmid-associated DNA primase
MGRFTEKIAVSDSAAFDLPCETVARRVLRAYKHSVSGAPGARPLEYCEMLTHETPTKPFFDMEEELSYIPDTDVLRATCVKWHSELVRVLKIFLPNLSPSAVLPMHRHRAKPGGGFKISLRCFVVGVVTTPLVLKILVATPHFAALPWLDSSVYSAKRKMSMPFCMKSTKQGDKHVLLPGFVGSDAPSVMDAPGFKVLDYVIQFVMPSDDTPLEAPPHMYDQEQFTNKRITRHVLTPGTSSSRTDPLLHVLESLGFVNPVRVGLEARQGVNLIVNFTADNRNDCPLCRRQHTSNNWYVRLGNQLVLANHSANCSDDIPLVAFRTKISHTLIQLISENGSSRHSDYAQAFAESCDGVLSWDEAQSMYFEFDPKVGKHVKVNDIHLRVQQFVEGVLTSEMTAIKALRVHLCALGCTAVVEELDEVNKRIRDAKTRIGTDGFNKSVVNQVKFRIVRDPQDTPDGIDTNLHFVDGVLNLDTQVFAPTVPEDNNRQTTDYRYNEPGWEDVDEHLRNCIQTILPFDDARTFFKLMCGYMLSGATDLKKIFACCDMKEGHNGKSLLLLLLSKTLGDYFIKPPRGGLSVSRSGGGESAAPFLMACMSKRLSVYEELCKSRPLDCAFLKDLASGLKQVVSGRQLYGRQTTFLGTIKIIMAFNRGAANMDTQDDAFKQRFFPIPFEVTFVSNPLLVCPPLIMPEDQNLKTVFQTDKRYHAAFVRYCLEGYTQLQADPTVLDDVNLPPRIMNFKNQVILYNDPAIEIINTHIMPTGHASDVMNAGELFMAYKQDKKAGMRSLKEADFYRTLKMYVNNVQEGAWVQQGMLERPKMAKIKFFRRRDY